MKTPDEIKLKPCPFCGFINPGGKEITCMYLNTSSCIYQGSR